MIISFSERKASVVERLNRTLKGLMFKFFTKNETRKYVDVLQDIVNRYNNGFHRSIKTTPASVTKENELNICLTLYSKTKKLKNKRNNQLNVDDLVRITHERGTFHKSYLEGWSEEIFCHII